jgi:calcium-dependent protein kinase
MLSVSNIGPLQRQRSSLISLRQIGVITYILLCGYPPFYGDSDTQIFDSVRVGKFDFPSPEWDDISASAKDFVIEMLQKDPIKRPTAAVAMKHRWFKEQLGVDANPGKGKSVRAPQESLSHGGPKTGEFTKYLALQKLKKAAFGYIASNMTHAEVGALEEQFRAIDKKNHGYITLTDLEETIAQGTINDQLRSGVKELREQLAVGADERLNWRDFLALTMDRSIAVREDNLKIAFEHFKHTNTDYLTASDLADIFGGQGQADDIMNLLDGDGDGKVSYEDFRFALMESLDETESAREDDDCIQ